MFDEEEEEPIVSPDTNNATHFHAAEAPADRRKQFKRFHGFNSGVYNGEWQDNEELRRLDNLALYDAVSSQLELTNYQKRSGRQLLETFKTNEAGYSVALISFVIASHVCRDDGRFYHPRRSDENNDDLFLDYTKDLKEDQDQIHAAFNRITGQLP